MYTINDDKVHLSTEVCIKILEANGFHILDNLTGAVRNIGVDAETLVLVNTKEPNDNRSISRNEITSAIIKKGSTIYNLYTYRLEKAIIAQSYVKLPIGERRKAEDEVRTCTNILVRLIFITGLRILILKSDSACEVINNHRLSLPLIDNSEENEKE